MAEHPDSERLSEPLMFDEVSGPPRFSSTTDAPVRVVDVVDHDRLFGHLWAAYDGEAAGFEVHEVTGDDAFNASVSWYRALRDPKARGLSALEALDELIASGGPIDAGTIITESCRDMESLAELKMLAKS